MVNLPHRMDSPDGLRATCPVRMYALARYFPAIAVSANTAIADNPSLTSRMAGGEWCPQRFV